VISLEEAQARILASVTPLSCEVVPLESSHGRYVHDPITALVNLPPFYNSAMDGYAVQAHALKSATPETPVILRLAGIIPAGEKPNQGVNAGTCVRVFTGSPLPEGADAVVMQEDTERSGDDTITFVESLKPWDHVRFQGEDCKAGTIIMDSGERLNAAKIALLAAAGVAEIPVSRRPRVTLLATGSELKPGGTVLRPGEIFESNRMMLKSLCEDIGVEASCGPIVKDIRAETSMALEKAFEESDVVITSGGVSVGDFDFVKDCFVEIGGKLEFWKVAIKPGKPFVWGRRGAQYFFGLPGNPASAFVTFLLLVRPALMRLQSAGEVHLPSQMCRLEGSLANPGDRRHFLRVVADSRGVVKASGPQASHRLMALAACNGLVDMPPGSQWSSGTEVSVLRWS
jgi:molybdopterin molybdotransferase